MSTESSALEESESRSAVREEAPPVELEKADVELSTRTLSGSDRSSHGWLLFTACFVFLNVQVLLWLADLSFRSQPGALFAAALVSSVLLLMLMVPLGKALLERLVRQRDPMDAIAPLALLMALGINLAIFALSTDAELLFSVIQQLSVIPILATLMLFVRERIERAVRLHSCLDTEKVFASAREGITPIVDSHVELVLAEDEIVPADGIVQRGSAQVYERLHAGAGHYRVLGPGSEIFAGSLILQGQLRVSFTGRSNESFLSNFSDVLEKVFVDFQLRLDRSRSRCRLFAMLIVFLAACAAMKFFVDDAGILQSAMAFLAVLCLAPLAALFFVRPLSQAATALNLFFRGLLVSRGELLSSAAQAKRVVFDLGSVSSFVQAEMREFRVIDDRYDEEAVASMLYALLSASSEDYATTICSHLRKEFQFDQFPQVSDQNEYEGRGIAASVQGIEVSFGSEDFLIERGCQIEISELAPEDAEAEWLYLAVGTDLIAHLGVSRDFLARDFDMLDMIRRQSSARPVLVSTEIAQEELDLLGQSAGFELSEIFGGLSEEQWRQKIDSWGPAIVYSSRLLESSQLPENAMLLPRFQPMAWNLGHGQGLLFGRSIAPLAYLLRLSRRVRRNWIFVACLSVVAFPPLLASVFLGNVGPMETMWLPVLAWGMALLQLRDLSAERSRFYIEQS